MYKAPMIAKIIILYYAHLLNRFRVRKEHTHTSPIGLTVVAAA